MSLTYIILLKEVCSRKHKVGGLLAGAL